jgi:FAD/FMN-containing dehydrogenase
MRERLGSRVIRCLGYGHVGDGNLHLNMTTKEFEPEVLDLIEPFVYEWTSKYRGSISAEHGRAEQIVHSTETFIFYFFRHGFQETQLYALF